MGNYNFSLHADKNKQLTLSTCMSFILFSTKNKCPAPILITVAEQWPAAILFHLLWAHRDFRAITQKWHTHKHGCQKQHVRGVPLQVKFCCNTVQTSPWPVVVYDKINPEDVQWAQWCSLFLGLNSELHSLDLLLGTSQLQCSANPIVQNYMKNNKWKGVHHQVQHHIRHKLQAGRGSWWDLWGNTTKNQGCSQES